MYEVLKFIEHGTQCRQSMDCERGSLLIYYLKDKPQIEKGVLFEWFRQIGLCVDQYHRCRRGQRYRYLNPYSIVVSEEGRLYLLDLEAPENEPVMKQMQHRSVRNHFIRPVSETKTGIAGDVDLFGYGRVIQFIMAYISVFPRLNRREERRLSRVVSRCTEVSGKHYGDIRQAVSDIPMVAKRPLFFKPPGRRAAAAAGVCFCVILAALAVRFIWPIQNTDAGAPGADSRINSKTAAGKTVRQQDGPEQTEGNGGADTAFRMTDDEIVSGAGEMLKTYLLQNTEEGNERVLLLGREMELDVVRSLAAVYERQDMREEAVLAYGRLVEIEEGAEQIENAAGKKMKLEAEQGQYAQAVLTGEQALARLEDSEMIRRQIDEYRSLGEQEEGLDEQN